jgi:hypothetical protein
MSTADLGVASKRNQYVHCSLQHHNERCTVGLKTLVLIISVNVHISFFRPAMDMILNKTAQKQ